MLIIPAIDLQKGKAVRLHRGKFDRVSLCDGEPDQFARDFISRGARRLHVILLLGARNGSSSTAEETAVSKIITIRNLYSRRTCSIQLGGGIRRSIQIRTLFDQSVDFVILGTAVLIPLALEAGFTMNDLKLFYQRGGRTFDIDEQAPEFDILERLTDEERRRVIVAVDYRDNEIGLSGWEVSVPLTPVWVVSALVRKGISRFLLTDIDRDGTMEGINPEIISNILEEISHLDPKPEVLVSGGVHSEEDLETLARLPHPPDGVVIGKALYEGRLHFRSLVARFPQGN